MAYFVPGHRGLIIKSSMLAEHIISKEMKWSAGDIYDLKTHIELEETEKKEGVFAHLVRVEPEYACRPHHYRICLQDKAIFDFLGRNSDVDVLSFITFIMTHELVHIHRFSTGKADFFTYHDDEEVYVDSLTRLFMAKNPINGLKKVLILLDKLEAAPLYNETILIDHRRNINAHL